MAKWINFNCPVIETSETIEPSGNALEQKYDRLHIS